MAKARTVEEKLLGAAVVKMTFRLRGEEESPEFKAIYPGILQDLDVVDAEVERFIGDHRDDVECRARTALKSG